MNNQLLKNRKIARQTIEIVTAYLTTKSSIYLTVLSLLTVIAPFLHLFATPGVSGYFGFSYMSSFLNALGLPLMTISMSLLMLFSSDQFNNEYSNPFKGLSTIILFIGCFYLFYVFIPMSDYSNFTYYSFVGILGLLLCGVLKKFHKAAIKTELLLKSHTRKLISILWNQTKKNQSQAEKEKVFFNITKSISDEY